MTIAAANKAGKIPGSSHGDPEGQTVEQASVGAAPGQSVKGATATHSGSALYKVLIIGALAGGGAAAVAGAANSQSNSQSNSVPSCDANSLRSQLVSAIQSAASCTTTSCENSAAPIAYNLWGQWCACLNKAAPSSGFMALTITDVGIGATTAQNAPYCD